MCDWIIKKFFISGNIETKSEETDVISRNVALRNELDLYVNVLECKSYPGIVSRHQNIDIIIVRQNTEGEYAMLEHEVSEACWIHCKILTMCSIVGTWCCWEHEGCYER